MAVNLELQFPKAWNALLPMLDKYDKLNMSREEEVKDFEKVLLDKLGVRAYIVDSAGPFYNLEVDKDSIFWLRLKYS